MAKGNKTNHPRKYVTVEKFDNFINNHFHLLKMEVRWHTWILLAILAAVIGKFLVDFFWG